MERTGTLAGTSIGFFCPWRSSSTRRATPSRTRMVPSCVPVPEGRGTHVPAGGVFPNATRLVCSVRLENPASGGESSSHPRASHRPFVGAIRFPIKQISGNKSKLLHSMVSDLLMLLNCNSSLYEKLCIAMISIVYRLHGMRLTS